MAENESKRRRVAPAAFVPGDAGSPSEEADFRLAVANSRLETRRPTRKTHPVPEAPTYRPTQEEFADPLAYIESIRAEAEPYGIIKVVPPEGWAPPCCVDWASDKTFSTKRQRVDLLQESKAYGDGRRYTLQSYRAMADAYMRAWLTRNGRCGDGGPADMKAAEEDYDRLADDYWDVVDRGTAAAGEVEVEYGNDVDANEYWSGFPRPDPARGLSAEATREAAFNSLEYHKRCGWNLNNIARWPSSLLKHISTPLAGVTSPWLYLGMLFSTFCWHNEDNYFSSINYHHAGAPKQWFGVPGSKAAAFENVVRRFYRQRLAEVPDLLHHMNTMFSPHRLKGLGVPVYRLLQKPGEFVVTFPEAFHGGFSHGFNCGEAVNFAAAHWIEHARLANERYRRVGRLAVVGHDRVMFTLARHAAEIADARGCALLRDELRRLVHEDLVLRPRLYAEGVRDLTGVVEAPPNETDAIDAAASEYDDKRVCAVCKHTCFLSAVACNCSQTTVCCLRHVSYMCDCPYSNKYLIEWESRPRLEAVVARVEARLEALGGAPPGMEADAAPAAVFD